MSVDNKSLKDHLYSKRPRHSRSRVPNDMTPPISDDKNCTRSSSRLKSKKGKKPEEDPSKIGTQQDLKRTQKVQSKEISFTKKLKTISTLPYNWCCTKVSTLNHSFKWTIENFSFFTLKKPGVAVESAKFTIPELANLQCRLLLYPNGYSDNCKDNACVTIQLSKGNITEMDYQLEFFNSRGTEVCNSFKISMRSCDKDGAHSGVCRMMKMKELLSLLDKDDTLTIFCSITMNCNAMYENSVGSAFQESANQQEVLDHIAELTKNNEFCDAVVSNGKIEFFAHKCILAVCCSHFERKLNDFQDKEFKIDFGNIENSSLRDILRFFYTGKVADIENSANDLFVLGYKIELPRLKMICEAYFKKNLNLENVFDVLSLADKFDALALKECAINYIVAHRIDVENSSRLLTKNLRPELIIQILQRGFD